MQFRLFVEYFVYLDTYTYIDKTIFITNILKTHIRCKLRVYIMRLLFESMRENNHSTYSILKNTCFSHFYVICWLFLLGKCEKNDWKLEIALFL